MSNMGLESGVNPIEIGIERGKITCQDRMRNSKIGLATPVDTISAVRECNWEQFKSRQPGDATTCAIEILVERSNLPLRVIEESLKRDQLKADLAETLQKLPTNIPSQSETSRIHRVRIQSRHILQVLNEVSGEAWDPALTHTFFRPFGFLIHHQDMVRERLQELDQRQETRRDEDATLSDIRCYVKFVDDALMPLYNQFLGDGGPRSVCFDDLWYLFRPGDLVHLEPRVHGRGRNVRGISPLVNPAEKTIWSVCSVQPHDQGIRSDLLFDEEFPAVKPTPTKGSRSRSRSRSRSPTRIAHHGLRQVSESDAADRGCCVVSCYYLDFNGDSVFPVWETVRITPYTGQRDICRLPVFPARYRHDYDEVREDLQNIGRKFIQCIRDGYMLHDGWSLSIEPNGAMIRLRADDEERSGPIQYSGPVMVDFREALRHHHGYVLSHEEAQEYEVNSSRSIEPYRVIEWADTSRSKIQSSAVEFVVIDDDVLRFEFNNYLKKDVYITAKVNIEQSESTRRGAPADANTKLSLGKEVYIPEEDYPLLPCRVFSYLLRERRFAPVDVRCLTAIPQNESAFDNLQLEESNKEIIKALVYTYFERKRMHIIRDQDLIIGKGRGVVILLQGEPGVGKTATAEAIAQTYGRPLFSVYPHDLKYKSMVIDDVFRLANLWDGIILIDDVDIYLPKRGKRDVLNSSALVSSKSISGPKEFISSLWVVALSDNLKPHVYIALTSPRAWTLTRVYSVAASSRILQRYHLSHHNEARLAR
jgi:hypothetical protein